MAGNGNNRAAARQAGSAPTLSPLSMQPQCAAPPRCEKSGETSDGGARGAQVISSSPALANTDSAADQTTRDVA